MIGRFWHWLRRLFGWEPPATVTRPPPVIKRREPRVIHRLLPMECYSDFYEDAWHPRMLRDVRFIVQHYFSAVNVRPSKPFDLETCWRLFYDLNFDPEDRLFGLYHGPRQPASAHYLITREGEAYLLVPVEYQAFHAGLSEYRGYSNLNACSIGIENIGMRDQPFTEAQYRKNAEICSWLMKGHGLSIRRVVGHSDIAIPRGRKEDPGPLFDWMKLKRYTEDAR